MSVRFVRFAVRDPVGADTVPRPPIVEPTMSILRLRATRLDALRSALAVGLIGCALAPLTGAVAQHRAVAVAPGAITLDGRLDEPVWAQAPVHDRFVQYDPYTGQPAPTITRVRVAYDMQALYVAIHAHDPRPAQIRAPLVRFDKVFRDQDFVVVYVDAIGTRAAAQFFRVNAAGGMADGVHTAATDNEERASPTTATSSRCACPTRRCASPTRARAAGACRSRAACRASRRGCSSARR